MKETKHIDIKNIASDISMGNYRVKGGQTCRQRQRRWLRKAMRLGRLRKCHKGGRSLTEPWKRARWDVNQSSRAGAASPPSPGTVSSVACQRRTRVWLWEWTHRYRIHTWSICSALSLLAPRRTMPRAAERLRGQKKMFLCGSSLLICWKRSKQNLVLAATRESILRLTAV